MHLIVAVMVTAASLIRSLCTCLILFCILLFFVSTDLLTAKTGVYLFLIIIFSLRAMQLASIFMSGIETAVIANDACGSPVPWEFCCPWLFFDGKLFHSKWLQSSMNVATLELCDGKVSHAHVTLPIRGLFFHSL